MAELDQTDPPKRKRKMDQVLQEMKQVRLVAPRLDESTNLYMTNIHPSLNESQLAQEFVKFGPIANIKILEPRNEQGRAKVGFISYMKKEDAEKALRKMDAMPFHGLPLKISWGKPVNLPETPLYAQEETEEPIMYPLSRISPKHCVYVLIPDDMTVLKRIHSKIHEILDGTSVDELNDLSYYDDLYFKWKLYSMTEGDSMDHWKTDPISMEDGSIWMPPRFSFISEVHLLNEFIKLGLGGGGFLVF
jgi:U2-associated protein SR140